MLSMFAKCNMTDRAHSTLTSIIESGLQPDLVTYNSLMDMYARGQECWKAEKILKNLQEPGSNSKPDLVSYNTVIKGFCRQGLMQEAMRVLAEMMNTRGIRPCIFTYNTFVTGYAARGMFEEVKDVVRYMIEHDCRPNQLTYKIAVTGYCKARKYDEALEFVSQIKCVDDGFDDDSEHRLADYVRDMIKSR
ncbi:Pentatricopeptide repeat-containing protein At2g18940, chloroplastic [Linum grandiflorum]